MSVFATINDYEKGQFTLPCQRALLCCAGIQAGMSLYPALPALRHAIATGQIRRVTCWPKRTREGGGGLLERECDSPSATDISQKARPNLVK